MRHWQNPKGQVESCVGTKARADAEKRYSNPKPHERIVLKETDGH